jgi:trans-2-enoyl-CoA reductase
MNVPLPTTVRSSNPNLVLRFMEPGRPEDVLWASPEPVPSPGPGEVLLRMHAAPINPADINVVQGVYGRLATAAGPPGAATGMEGVGTVVESRSPGFTAGDRAIVVEGLGTWARYLTIPAADTWRVPADLPLEQAAMLRVNPLTALRLLLDAVPLEPGGWILQNAANSGVGRCVIQLAAVLGWRTANLVRRAADRTAELEALGADLVLEDGDPETPDKLAAATGGARPVLGLNAVGGDSGSRMLRLLAPGGCLVTYGGMSRRSLKVSTSQLVFHDLHLRGFWLARWLERTPRPEVAADLERLAGWVAAGRLVQAIDSRHPLESFPAAIRRAQEEFRDGRVLFAIDDLDPAG